ncbi:MAG: hypothetical protein Q4A78_01630 [Peptostreptococcaceae bacterium]|nr:hypothetical protein [Peptostreptococcaceae bacterium]
MEKLKDFIYAISDILFGIFVLAVVVFIFLHQLQHFFSPEMITGGSMSPPVSSVESKDRIPAEQTKTPPAAGKDPSSETEALSPRVQEGVQTEPQPKTMPRDETSSAEMTEILIPAGSTSDSIAAILHENQLISSESQFVTTLMARGLDTKLKAGTFSIPKDAGLDEIIAILTK